jgi:putative hydrolase of the HAD superfamily
MSEQSERPVTPAKRLPMIRAIIFDLDNCLSAADESSRQLLEPVFAAVRQSNHGTLSDGVLAQAFDDCWRDAFDVVAQRHGFSREMLEAGWNAAAHAEVTAPLQGYPDLGALHELSVKLFLVTSGFRRLQESKISALHITELFTEVHVVAIDEENRRGKRQIFADILATYRLSPAEVLVVGDNPDSEIEAGNQLGITTVQILRSGVRRGDNAAYYIDELAELAQLI